MSECPLCTIPQREEVLYNDSFIYLVNTKDMKGHRIRIMAVIKRHSLEPNFKERTLAYGIIIAYMKKHVYDSWFIVDDSYASVTDHWHLVACDKYGTIEEQILLSKTPKIEFPIGDEN